MSASIRPGQMLGVVGLGGIGLTIVRKASAALDMWVHYFGPRRKNEAQWVGDDNVPAQQHVAEEGLYFQPADVQGGGDARVGAAGRHPGDALRDRSAVVVD